MKKIAITQRVSVVPEYGERRDCLDQAWPRFLAACGLMPLVLPNVIEVALALCAGADVAGLVLTGGNDLAAVGGDAPERDATENALLDVAESRGLPVLGRLSRDAGDPAALRDSAASRRGSCDATSGHSHRRRAHRGQQLSSFRRLRIATAA